MKYLIMCLLLFGCYATQRIHWYCDNHKEENNGKGHLQLDRKGRLYASKTFGCKGWYPELVEVR